MVDASYKNSACPYHRARYWLSQRWVQAPLLLIAALVVWVIL